MEEFTEKLYCSLSVSRETRDRLKVYCAQKKVSIYDFLEKFLNEKMNEKIESGE